MEKARLSEHGHEIPDPKPVSIPSGFKRPESLAEQVQRLVRTSISREAAERGKETFEESEDFDVDDEVDPSSPYEAFFDPVLGKDITAREFREYENIYRQRYIKSQQEYFAYQDRLRALNENPPKVNKHRPSDDVAPRREGGEDVKGAKRPSEAGPQDP